MHVDSTCRYLDAFFQRLKYEPVERFCRACLECKGTILFTGVGKSGFIAQKISQTLVGFVLPATKPGCQVAGDAESAA